MAKKNTTTNQSKTDKPRLRLFSFFKKRETQIVLGILLVGVSIYLSIVVLSFLLTGSADYSKVNTRSLAELSQLEGNIRNFGGGFGAWISNFIVNHWFGFPILFPILFVGAMGLRLFGIQRIKPVQLFFITSFSLIWSSLALGFFFRTLYESSFLYWGGAHGHFASIWMRKQIGWPGVFLILLSTLLIFLLFVRPGFVQKIGLKLKQIASNRMPIRFQKETLEESSLEPESDAAVDIEAGTVPEEFEESWTTEPSPIHQAVTVQRNTEHEQKQPVKQEEILPEPDDIDFEIRVGSEDDQTETIEEELPTEPIIRTVNGREEYDASYMGEYDPKRDLSRYKYPDTDLLPMYEKSETVINTEEQNSNKRRIQEVLEQFGIRISSITATVGATVTLYEIIPEPGIRISRIKSLENDIALSLAALGIRIIAPIPGKGTIGIEVPNRDPQIVSMHGVLNSRKFKDSKYELPIALGRTITNDIFMVDLCKMPHVLVAGATGQGKSVGLNAMITSLLYKKHPAELKFVLIDPKMVEFNIYSSIEKHFLAKLPDDGKAIITDFTKVIQTLNSLTREMDDRYNLLMMANVRNIKEYNSKFVSRHLNPEKGHKFLPYIVVVIDEFGDLIMTAGKEIEMPIARIAQKARAVGIHMIIATQRPTTNIITGTIKANFPARVAFRVISVTDSRTILDASGANQLIGRGDLLFSQGSDLVRVQCAFVDTPEVLNVTNFISNQPGYSTAFELPEPQTEGGSTGLASEVGERDPMFEDAARLIVMHQQGSTSLIQRKFSIGYNRAGRIVDQLEAAGIIGPNEGSKARQVLVDDEYHLENVLSQLK